MPTGIPQRPVSNKQTYNPQHDREMAMARNAVTVKVVRIANGYEVIEVGSGQHYAYPELGHRQLSGDDPMNVCEHLFAFFSALETEAD